MKGDKSESNRYRFSGYSLPLHQWDETGASWIKIDIHPYFRNQPVLWQSSWSFGTPSYSLKKTNLLPINSTTNSYSNAHFKMLKI